MSAAIELARPRLIVIGDRGRKYKLTVAPVTKKQWLKYFDGIVNTSEYSAGSRIDNDDSSAARRELAESALIDAEGYTSTQPLKEIENWQSKLPASHLLTVGNVLTSVGRSAKADTEPIALGQETVFLDAVWDADEDGAMRKYTGLVHRFETPTAEHQRRFSRAASRSVVVGGGRNAKTRWLGAQSTLAELYDELIVSVEGYTANGQPLGGREAIAGVMDTHHKVAAAMEVFAPAAVDFADEGAK